MGPFVMITWFKQLDSILRGDATRMTELDQGRIEIPIGGLSLVLIVLGMVYGVCMGTFAAFRAAEDAHMFMIASAVKVPLLFLLTLIVTFPSLYVFSALVGSRLSIVSVLRLLVAAVGVMLAVMSSLGPIVVFFAVSTTNYQFMQVLNVLVGLVSGVLGLAFLLRTLHRLMLIQESREFEAQPVQPPSADGPPPPTEPVMDEPPPATDGGSDDHLEPPSSNSGPDLGALDRVGRFTHQRAKLVFRFWVVVFSLVGAQMSWVLRPFIGSPSKPFEWFREREGNFFLAVLHALEKLMTGQ